MFAVGCTSTALQNQFSSSASFDWHLPPGFAAPEVPDTNPVSEEKIQLGRRLFYDTRLSVNGQASCGSCHQQRLAFTDGQSRSSGATGERHARSSMSLINVAYNRYYTWASRDIKTLEQQIRIPLFNKSPVELGLSGREETLVAELGSEPGYASQFQRAFPESTKPVSIDNMIRAIASFVRSIISADSPFDRLLYLDDRNALSASALRGMRLFFSKRLNCGACHAGQNLAGAQDLADPDQEAADFHNTGLYNVRGQDRYPGHDPGLRAESGQMSDDGKYRAPSLRNIAITAPYMHDGSIDSLDGVIDHYRSGGRTIKNGRFAGIGKENRLKSPLLRGFDITDSERQDLIDFFESLTDPSILEDPRFSPPVPGGDR